MDVSSPAPRAPRRFYALAAAREANIRTNDVGGEALLFRQTLALDCGRVLRFERPNSDRALRRPRIRAFRGGAGQDDRLVRPGKPKL